MTSTPGTYFQLNWRDMPRIRAMQTTLVDILTNVDSSDRGELEVCLVNSKKTKSFVDPTVSGLPSKMWLQSRETATRTLENDKQAEYIAKFYIIARFISRKMDARLPSTNRAVGYRLVSKLMKQDTISRMIKDLALTMNVHPYALGIVPENKGRVYVPDGVIVKTRTVGNILAYAENKGSHVLLDLQGGETREVPRLIHSLQIVKPEKIRAVIVCEHRSMSSQFEEMERIEEPLMDGFLVLMSGGFSDASSKEFLSLLSQLDNLKDTPFLFMSDCDPHAITIFTNFKFGSACRAYESSHTICPKLMWIGLTHAQYDVIADKWPEQLLKDALKLRPNMSKSDQATFLAREKEHVRTKGAKVKARPTAQINKADRDRMDHLFKAGLLDGPGEQVVKAQLEALRDGGHKLSVYDLDTFNTFGVLTWVRDAVAGVRGEYAELPEQGVDPTFDETFVQQQFAALRMSQTSMDPESQAVRDRADAFARGNPQIISNSRKQRGVVNAELL